MSDNQGVSVVQDAASQPAVRSPSKKWLWMILVAVVLFTTVIVVTATLTSKEPPPTRVALGNGQLLQIEKIAYGTHHHFGGSLAFVGRVTRKLPVKLQQFFGVDSLVGFETERATLVMWLSVLDEATGTNVDSRGIMGQLMDQKGDAFIFSARSFGKPSNWRSAAVFHEYPRGDTNLTLQVRVLRNPSQVVSVDLANPHAVKPAKWSGEPLPQSRSVSGIEIVLSELRVQQMPKRTGILPSLRPQPVLPSFDAARTNYAELQRATRGSWNERMRAAFVPSGKCLSNGKPALGWSAPQWTSEDRFGNRTASPGTNEPVLKFCATVYPYATNSAAAQLISTLPSITLTSSTTNSVWNQTNSTASGEIVVLGLFQPGTHTFSNGFYRASSAELPEPQISPVSNDRNRIRQTPRTLGNTGWELSPKPMIIGGRAYFQRSHSTSCPAIYVRVKGVDSLDRVGIRFRDGQGRQWSARAESINFDQIHVFYVELPEDATNVLTEVVALKPLQAEFLVDTRNFQKL